MKGAENKFIIKMEIAPESLHYGRKILVYKGTQCPVVYDFDNKCLGVVWEHYSHALHANGQAEICFYEEYFSEYGMFHRMFNRGRKGGERIQYQQLQKDLSQDKYTYTGYIMDK